MSSEHRELYGFDKFRLDVSERILWREDERVPLSEKAFDTLCALVRHGDHLVSKDELLNEVWADAIVEENNLDKNISLLRQVLGERPGEGKFIETVRGHGYRFIAEIDSVSSNSDVRIRKSLEITDSAPQIRDSFAEGREPNAENRSRNIFILAALILMVAASAAFYLWRRPIGQTAISSSIKSLAVLPFKPLVAENRNEALEFGMTDTLISKLGNGEGITVRPLSSVRRYGGMEQDAITAGRDLGVESILDGTIQTSDDRIRISAKLLRTSDGKQLWAGQFDEKFTDIFAVQDSISEKVATALKIQLADGEKKHYTQNVEAYQLFMKGRFHLLKGTNQDRDKSISYFQQAIQLDPNYALAYTGLADAYRGQTVGGEMPPNEIMPKAKAAANKAIEIDDSLAEAHANLGIILFWYEWDWNAAEKEYNRAMDLDANSPDTLQFYAHLLSCTGQHAEALAKIKRARELDPLNLRINAIEGMLLYYAGQNDEAIDRLQKTLELDPNYRLALMIAARAYIEKGMYAEAIDATRRARDISLSSEPIAYESYALAKSGREAEAQTELDELLKASTEKYVSPYSIALIYNALGHGEKALDYLEKAFAEKDVRMVWLKVEPKWNNLRSELRFIDLMKRMKF